MPPSDLNVGPEAQTDVDERQADDTAEKQRRSNTKTRGSGMLAHCLMSPSPHLSFNRELWGSFWQAGCGRCTLPRLRGRIIR